MSIAKFNIGLSRIAIMAAVAALPLGNPALAEPLASAMPRGGLSELASPQPSVGSAQDGADLPAHLRRQVVDFRTTETAGTIIIDTPNTYLYYVLVHRFQSSNHIRRLDRVCKTTCGRPGPG